MDSDPQPTVSAEESDEKRFIAPSIFGRLSLFVRMGVGVSAALGFAMVLSAVSQVLPVLYLVLFVPDPPQRTFAELMDDRFVAAAMQDEEEPEEEEPLLEEEEAEEEEEDADPILAAPEPEPEPEPAPEPEPEPEPEPAPEPEPEPEPAPVSDDDGGGMDVMAIGGGEGDGGGGGPSNLETGGGGTHTVPDRETVSERREDRRADRREDRERSEEDARRVARVQDTSTPPCQHQRREPEIGYPDEFREQALAGTVVIQCLVNESGRIGGCRHRGGPDQLFSYAKGVVEQWRCSPAEDAEGERIVAPYTWRIPFNLES